MVRRFLVCIILACLTSSIAAAADRAFPEGKQPDDRRLGDLKSLDGYFPFEPPTSVETWRKRAADLRRQTLVSQGLWPMPRKTPARAVVHGLVDRDDYTVERVFLESYPGHFVTGSLYRPKGASGRRAAVLCPHGHWPNGRFMETPEKTLKEQIAAGAERFDPSGAFPLQARCVQLARMGCVVFHYDMIGYADSQQIAHRPGVRPEMNTDVNWGFFSPQAELRLQGMMGLQTYNSIRALDWLAELPDVDPERIAVTGASGGGTQTFVLCTCDPRPAAQWPAVMVSTAMQGGCTCENSNYLRLNTGNVELAGTFAPKPLGMSGANDWTKEIETKGYPELQQLYGLFDAHDRVFAKALTQFPHNYNAASRALMYAFFNKHLKLGASEPVEERDFKPLSVEEMTVWDDKHPKPPAGDDYERSLLKVMTDDSDLQLADVTPKDVESFDTFNEFVGGGWSVLIGRGLPDSGDVEHEKIAEQDRDTYLEFTSVLRNKKHGEAVPTVFLMPKQWNKRVVVWADERGKQALWADDGSLASGVRKLIDAGYTVAAPDCYGTGEFTADGKPVSQQRLQKGPKIGPPGAYVGYTFGYNHSLLAQRAHDLLSVISYVRNHKDQPDEVNLVGVGGAGPWVLAARAIATGSVDRAAVDTRGFRFAKLNAFDDPNFVPGSVKYGDLPALAALSAPFPLWIAGEGSVGPPLVRDTYEALDHPTSLTIYDGASDDTGLAAAMWIVEGNVE